jgi:L-gulonate 5-dehydrogenase
LLAEGKIHYPRVATEFSMWDAPGVFEEMNATPGKVHKGVLMI